jgi:hypothetical protein
MATNCFIEIIKIKIKFLQVQITISKAENSIINFVPLRRRTDSFLGKRSDAGDVLIILPLPISYLYKPSLK